MWFYTVKAHTFHGKDIIYYWTGDGSDIEAERETWKRKVEEGTADDGSSHQCFGTVPAPVSVLTLHQILLIRNPCHISLCSD